MSRKQLVTLTNMCMIEDQDENVVVQIRDPKRYSWSGAAFPGGHIEKVVVDCLGFFTVIYK